jgi:hypothetical protein
MARQNINIGTAANDGTGDKLRVAFDKVNDNFIELYEQGDKGAKGDKGEPGSSESGVQGAQGFQGVQGATGSVGAQGDVGTKGEKGDVGEQGSQGTQGIQGASGSGTQGAQGVQGDKGETGAQGVQGDQGVVGAQGDQGSQGDQGVAGDQGDQGAVGDQGAQGVQGSEGTGVQGAQGFQGVQGAAGSTSLPLANGTSEIDISAASGNVSITSNNYTWDFSDRGYLHLPLGQNNESIVTFATNPGGGSFDQADIKFYVSSGENTVFEIKNRNDALDIIKLDASGPISLVTDGDGNIGGPYTWQFSTSGSVTFPDSTTQTTAFTANPTVNILNVKEVIETTNALSSATGTVTHNCALGHIFVHSSVSANFTANFTDVTIPANTATAFTLVINQSSTAYVANLVQIGGVAQTVNWQGSTTEPAGNANKKDVISFSVVNNNGTFITLGQLTTFG